MYRFSLDAYLVCSIKGVMHDSQKYRYHYCWSLHNKLVLKADNFLNIILNTTFCYLLNKLSLFT